MPDGRACFLYVSKSGVASSDALRTSDRRFSIVSRHSVSSGASRLCTASTHGNAYPRSRSRRSSGVSFSAVRSNEAGFSSTARFSSGTEDGSSRGFGGSAFGYSTAYSTSETGRSRSASSFGYTPAGHLAHAGYSQTSSKRCSLRSHSRDRYGTQGRSYGTGSGAAFSNSIRS